MTLIAFRLSGCNCGRATCLQEKIYLEKVTECEEAVFSHMASAEVSVLATALNDFKCLKSLTLQFCEYGERGAADLVKAGMHPILSD